MPELPEVQTVGQQISQILPLEVTALKVSKHFPSFFKDEDFFWPKDLAPLTIVRCQRKAKFLLFTLQSKKHGLLYFISHLGMSGAWLINTQAKFPQHVHLELVGQHGTSKISLAFYDPRRFGRMSLLTNKQWQQREKNLPPEITSENFNQSVWANQLKRYPARLLKVSLLDQKLFPGIGNYMASEICARAGIRPTRRCGRIRVGEIEKLHQATAEVISGAQSGGGTTFSGGYQDTQGNDGGGLSNLVVFYQKNCGLCRKTAVKKIYLAGRGTYYCPHCQK